MAAVGLWNATDDGGIAWYAFYDGEEFLGGFYDIISQLWNYEESTPWHDETPKLNWCVAPIELMKWREE